MSKRASNGQAHGETTAHVEVNCDSAANEGAAVEGIELAPTAIGDGKNFTAVPVTSDDEASPLRAVESRTNGHKNGTANENVGGGAADMDSPSDDGDDDRPSKKRCPCWDARCVLMGLLILFIIVIGGVMALIARSEPGLCNSDV